MSSASEAAATATMTSGSPFNVVPISTAPSQTPAAQTPMEQQMHMNFAAYGPQPGSSPLPYQSIPAGTDVIKQVNSSEQKRKRGRPRKYGPDGNMNSTQQPIGGVMPQNFSSPPLQTESPTVKKARGRPPGPNNKKQRVEEPLGSNGIGFIPHVLHVKNGEDVASKIMAFSQNGPRAVCVLSASGAIANVTLRQAATSGGTATYEGRYDILSLSGSFMLMEVGGQKTRTGGLNITLAGSDGRVLGGCVAGVLLAATPVQVIVGSFLAEGRQDQRSANQMEPSSAPARANMGVTAGTSSSPSRGTMSESSSGAGSPFNHSSGNNLRQGMPGLPWK